MREKRSMRSLWTAMVCAAIALLIAINWQRGIALTIHNSGTLPLRDLQAQVTGQTIDLGNCPSGKSIRCFVHPSNASNVKLAYRLDNGTIYQHDLECYLEKGYGGSIQVELDGRDLIKTIDNSTLPYFP